MIGYLVTLETCTKKSAAEYTHDWYAKSTKQSKLVLGETFQY